MRKVWLRDREISPNRQRSEIEYRPFSANINNNEKIPPITTTTNSINSTKNKLLSSSSSPLLHLKEQYHHNNHNSHNNNESIFYHGPGWKESYRGQVQPRQIPSLNRKVIEKTQRIISKAENEDVRYKGQPGSPGGHIARAVAKSFNDKDNNSISGNSNNNNSISTNSGKGQIILRLDSKPYQFTENVDDMLSFGHFDIDNRPDWDPRFQEYPKEVAEKELKKRIKQRAREKSLASSETAILIIMKDILEMYTSKFEIQKSPTAKFQSPDHLNIDETHVWLRLRIALIKSGELITHRQLEALSNICRQFRESTKQSNKKKRVKIPPILVHFLRYLNLVLGGSSSFRSAQIILLRDLSYLLKLIQNIDPLKLPLENLRNATAFRMKESKKLSFLQQQERLQKEQLAQQQSRPSYCSTNDSISTNITSKSNQLSNNTKKMSNAENTFTNISLLIPGENNSNKLEDESNQFAYNQVALDNLCQYITSWIFSFSLLSKIALISGERTPIDVLLEQKKSSPTNSFMVSRRISKVSDCKQADSLFSTSNILLRNNSNHSISSMSSNGTNGTNGLNNNNHITSPKSPGKESSRRGSLSSLLGNVSSGTYPETPQDILSRQHSLNDNSIIDESLSNSNDQYGKYLQELQVPRTPPAKFGELQRLDSRTYGDLETLLLSRIESYAEYNYNEEGATSYDSSGQLSDTLNFLELEDDFFTFGDDEDDINNTNKRFNPSNFGLELSSKESKFRINNKGEILVEEDGEYRRATKNLSLYYDMITDRELEKLHEHQSITSITSPSSSSSSSLSPKNKLIITSNHPFQTSKHELTAVDMLTPNRAHSFISSINNEKKQKEILLEKNSDFIDTLCRITELKSQTSELNKIRKPKSNHIEHHPLHTLFTPQNH